MTPTRAKRTSKAPNRFSSDSTRVDLSNSVGESTIDGNEKGTSSSQGSISRQNKLKPVSREPLKVKLPKLKRPHLQSTNESPTKGSKSEIKVHKIKLPKLSKKHQGDSKESDIKKVTVPADIQDDVQSRVDQSDSNDSLSGNAAPVSNPSPTIAKPKLTAQDDLDASKSSISTNNNSDISPTFIRTSEAQRSSSPADTSLSSDDGHSSGRMEITISRTSSPNGTGIRCPCGVDDDLGVMVECEKCSQWQHGHCINVGTEEEAYEGYICAFCSLPKDQVRESLQQLYVVDEFLPRLKLIESQMGQDPALVVEKNKSFLLHADELNHAVSDLKRVLGSLRVKWRLLTSPSYEIELRIWQNPYWSDEKTDLSGSKNFYFLDRCKQNLKLNIRNMLKKMEARCRSIDFAITLAELSAKIDGSHDNLEETKLSKSREFLELVAKGIQEYQKASERLDHPPVA